MPTALLMSGCTYSCQGDKDIIPTRLSDHKTPNIQTETNTKDGDDLSNPRLAFVTRHMSGTNLTKNEKMTPQMVLLWLTRGRGSFGSGGFASITITRSTQRLLTMVHKDGHRKGVRFAEDETGDAG
jgi:hypothetical protein